MQAVQRLPFTHRVAQPHEQVGAGAGHLRRAGQSGDARQAQGVDGDITLKQSLWRLACGEGVVVRLWVLEAQATAHADRRALAERLRGLVAAKLAETAETTASTRTAGVGV